MNMKIPYALPSITDLEISYATDAAANGWGQSCYSYIERFEKQFVEHLGVRHAIATSSCTGAMHLGLAGLGIGNGDEVILADTNWIATVAPIVHAGAIPIFVDVRADTWCISVESLEAAISPQTRAIVATHLYGNLADLDQIIEIGHRYGIPVIEDAAEAIGSSYHGSAAGSRGRFGTFSFHGTKTVTTGEGGMWVSNDSDLFERVLSLSNHGRDQNEWRQFVPRYIGFKFKMSNIQAALGCAQIERVSELVARKKQILEYYRDRLGDLPGASMNPLQEGCSNGAWMPTIRLERYGPNIAEILGASLTEAGIDARPFFPPLSSLEMFEARPENVTARQLAQESINLPSFHDMTETQMDVICEVVEGVAATSAQEGEVGFS